MYLVGARYNKARLRFLYQLGYTNEEMSFRRCTMCHCKVVIHNNSLTEWANVEYQLICGECEKTVSANSKWVIKGMTPRAIELWRRDLRNLRRN